MYGWFVFSFLLIISLIDSVVVSTMSVRSIKHNSDPGIFKMSWSMWIVMIDIFILNFCNTNKAAGELSRVVFLSSQILIRYLRFSFFVLPSLSFLVTFFVIPFIHAVKPLLLMNSMFKRRYGYHSIHKAIQRMLWPRTSQWLELLVYFRMRLYANLQLNASSSKKSENIE